MLRKYPVHFCLFAILLLSAAAQAQDIFEAAKAGNIKQMRTLIASDSKLLNATDNNGNTPLHLACAAGHTGIVSLLIEAGADLNTVNRQSMTPLRLAIQATNIDIVNLLLDHGAATDDNHPMFGSVMEQAFAVTCQKGGGPDMVESLIGHGLIFDGAKIDALGMSPLDWTAHFGNVAMARLALRYDANVNVVSQRLGRPPLVSAVSKGDSDLVRLFLEHGADVNLRDKSGYPPIFYAVDQGRTAILKDLLAHRASTDFIEPHYGRGLLHLAAIKGYGDIAEALADNGGIESKDASGKTPLFYAIQYGNRNVADFLTAWGAKNENKDSAVRRVLTDKPKTGEARISYLNNRGWTVQTKNHFVVFDAEEFGIRRSDNPGLANGFLTADELNGQNVISLFSCYHGYPGEPAYIHLLADSLDHIAYVHPVDDAWRGSPNTTYLSGQADTSIDDIKVQSIAIADYMPMLAYMCEMDGLTIYYQAFATDDPDKLRKNYEFLNRYADTVDIALLPLPEPEQQDPDIKFFLERFPARTIILLDSNRREYMFRDAARQITGWGCPAEIFCAQNPGDWFSYRRPDR